MNNGENSGTTFTFSNVDAVGPDISEIVSQLISMICISVLAVAMGSKAKSVGAQSLSYAHYLVYALYYVSWTFAVTSVIVMLTNNSNMVSCTVGLLACDIFYAGSKAAIYAWLIERVHLVQACKTDRLKSRQYKAHLLLLCPYIVIFSLMLTYRNIEIESDGRCIIGLLPLASVPLLVYDLVFNSYLTWLFLKPLLNVGRSSKKNWKRTRLYNIARRTFVASLVCLTVSFGNVLFVAISQGHQRGMLCLTMCTVDVTVNVVVIHWVTIKRSRIRGIDDSAQSEDHITAEITFECDTVFEKTIHYPDAVRPTTEKVENESVFLQ